jgi:hypothetical protein
MLPLEVERGPVGRARSGKECWPRPCTPDLPTAGAPRPYCQRSLPGLHLLLLLLLCCAGLQAYERQLEAANRAMRRGGEAADGLDRERQALLEQLRAAEQVRKGVGLLLLCMSRAA